MPKTRSICSAISIEHELVTDTDGRTDKRPFHSYSVIRREVERVVGMLLLVTQRGCC